jgi:UDP-glucose:(heptosyl)LPS alpha-1,3-glucosyltransferase
VRLLLISRPFVFHGGVETATAGLVAALVEHGYDVHLLSGAGQDPVPGVVLHRLPLPRRPALARLLALVAGTRMFARRRSWDVVQSHERTLGQDVYRAGEGCHRAYLEARDGGGGRGAYHRVVLALERRLFATTPRIVAIARAGAAEIGRLYHVPPARLDVIYNGVDLERFHPRNRARHRAAARAEAGIPADAWTALFLGSGFERKGLATAMEALARARDGAVHLLVVGKGDTTPYRRLADRLGVAPRVAWLGARPDAERWYAAADVLVLPTRYEPFGNVHLEALASGVPVVASARAGGAELVDDGRNGVVVDPRDPAKVAAALDALRASDAVALAEAARRSAEPFTYAAQVAGFARVYHAIARASGDFP